MHRLRHYAKESSEKKRPPRKKNKKKFAQILLPMESRTNISEASKIGEPEIVLPDITGESKGKALTD
jgi:hypothetical protein